MRPFLRRPAIPEQTHGEHGPGQDEKWESVFRLEFPCGSTRRHVSIAGHAEGEEADYVADSKTDVGQAGDTS